MKCKKEKEKMVPPHIEEGHLTGRKDNMTLFLHYSG
jgi:hypothetical protein